MPGLPEAHRPSPRWLTAVPRFPVVIAVATLGLTALAFGLLWRAEQNRLRADLDRLGRDKAAAIEHSIVRARLGLELLVGFFRGSEEVTRSEFEIFVQPYLRRDPCLEAMGWVPIVPQDLRAAYEARAQREGLASFRFTERDPHGAIVSAGPRSSYYPVYFLQPREGNEEVLGFDLGSEIVRLEALQRAGGLGQMVATPPIGLVPTLANRTGFLLLAPILDRTAVDAQTVAWPAPPEEFALAVLRADRLIHDALGHSRDSGVDVHVFHLFPGGHEQLLGTVRAPGRERRREPVHSTAPLRGQPHHAKRIDVCGQDWLVLTTLTPGVHGGQVGWQPWIVLVAGLLMSALSTAHVTMLQRTAARTHAFALLQSQSRSLLEREVEQRKRAQEEIRALNEDLERRVALRTEQLEAANRELSSFAYSVSHDLRAPLRAIDGFSRILLEDYGRQLDPEGRDHLQRVSQAACRMGELIDDLLSLSRMTRAELRHDRVNLSDCAEAILEELRARDPHREVSCSVEADIVVDGDATLLRAVMENLIGNAWKFTVRSPRGRLEFGRLAHSDAPVFYVRDNGVGFDMRYADKLFGPFQRLHAASEFEGHGIGLATVQRILHRHGGRIWAEAEVGRGATFFFTLGTSADGELTMTA